MLDIYSLKILNVMSRVYIWKAHFLDESGFVRTNVSISLHNGFPISVLNTKKCNVHNTICCNIVTYRLIKQLHHVLNSLWPSDTIWQQRSVSTMAQVTACCLTAPSHYLNQCWLVIYGDLWHSLDNKFTGSTQYKWIKWVWKLHFENHCHISQWVNDSSVSQPCGYWCVDVMSGCNYLSILIETLNLCPKIYLKPSDIHGCIYTALGILCCVHVQRQRSILNHAICHAINVQQTSAYTCMHNHG